MDSKIYRYLLVLTFFAYGGLCSQDQRFADSLLNVIDNTDEDTARVIAYRELTKYYFDVNIDTAVIYANDGLKLSKKIEYDYGIGEFYAILGDLKVIQEDLYEALDYYMKSANQLKKSGLYKSLSPVYLVIGNIFYSHSNYPKALEYYHKGLNIADSLNIYSRIPLFYSNMGAVNILLDQHEEALKAYKNALEIYEDLQDSIGIASIHSNVVNAYINFDSLDKAKYHLDKAFFFYKESSDYQGLLNAFNQAGSIEIARKNYSSAIRNYKEALLYYNKIGTEYLGPKSIFLITIHSKIGYCYLKLRNFRLAEENLLLAGELANRMNSVQALRSISQDLSELYEKIGNKDKALEYYKFFKLYSDSLSKDENVKKLTQLEMQFDFDKHMKESELAQLKYKESHRRKELWYLIGIGGAVLSLIVLALYVNMQRLRRKNLLLERESLKSDLDFKNKELTTNVMYLLKKNEFIIKISDKLKKSKYSFKPENRKIIDDIIRELEATSREVSWEEFEVRFQQIHSGFYDNLIKKYPDLSPNELKLSAFLRLNMSTKEISAITFQSPKSISMARFRLRKKMNIGSYDNLIQFLSRI